MRLTVKMICNPHRPRGVGWCAQSAFQRMAQTSLDGSDACATDVPDSDAPSDDEGAFNGRARAQNEARQPPLLTPEGWWVTYSSASPVLEWLAWLFTAVVGCKYHCMHGRCCFVRRRRGRAHGKRRCSGQECVRAGALGAPLGPCAAGVRRHGAHHGRRAGGRRAGGVHAPARRRGAAPNTDPLRNPVHGTHSRRPHHLLIPGSPTRSHRLRIPLHALSTLCSTSGA